MPIVVDGRSASERRQVVQAPKSYLPDDTHWENCEKPQAESEMQGLLSGLPMRMKYWLSM